MGYKLINKYLTVNRYSRPGRKLKFIKGIVVHWVANPKSTAMNNRNFFESRKHGEKGHGSAHEVIGLNGEIVVCLPKDELSYAVGSKQGYTQDCLNKLGSYPNGCTYNIECCHLDWNGRMTSDTYNTLVERVSDLCIEFKLDPLRDLWTHQQVVGWKDCHRWFVNNPSKWNKFKEDVKERIQDKIFEKVGKSMLQEVSSWAEESVENMKRLGVLKGDEKGNINPKNTVTREELCVFLDRLREGIVREIKG